MRCSLFALPVFGVCLVIQPSNSGKIICGKNQYTIVHSTGTVQSCLSCETCHKGLGLYPECGSTLLGRPITIECRPCKPGTFSSEYDSSPYKGCHQCAEYQIEKAECTNRSDTVCTVIQPSNSEIICGKNQYTIVNSSGTVQSCLACETCHKGFGLHPECGSTLLGRPTTIECRPCKTGTFSSENDSSSCRACHQCAEHQIKKAECTNRSDTVCTVMQPSNSGINCDKNQYTIVNSTGNDSSPCKACQQCAVHEIKEAECTNKSDTVCSGKCEQGYFMSKTVHNCLECSACCSDGKDEKIEECVGLGIKNKECSPRPEKTCTDQPPTTDGAKGSGGLAMKYLIIIIIVATSIKY